MKKVTWHVTTGETIHDFNSKKAAKAFAQWVLGDDRLVWKSISE